MNILSEFIKRKVVQHLVTINKGVKLPPNGNHISDGTYATTLVGLRLAIDNSRERHTTEHIAIFKLKRVGIVVITLNELNKTGRHFQIKIR